MSDLLLYGAGSPSVGVDGLGTSTVFVECAFGGTWRTAADDLTWFDETGRVMFNSQASTRRGRQRELDRSGTGTLTLTLRNAQDRRFDPTYTDGPYFGMLLPGTPIRVRVEVGATEFPVFYGFVEEWPQGYSHRDNANTVEVAAYDWFSVAAGTKLAGTLLPALLEDDPTVVWMLDESGGDTMIDSSGNQHDGNYQNVEFGQDPVAAAATRSVGVAHSESSRGRFNGPLVNAYPFTIEAWVRVPQNLSEHKTIIWLGRDATKQNQYLEITIPSSSGLPGYGQVELAYSINGATIGVGNGTRRVDDGEPHHIAAIFTSSTVWSLRIDGTNDGMSVAINAPFRPGWTFWSVGNLWSVGKEDFGLGGDINAVAIFPTEVSAARISAHYAAGGAAWSGDTVATRVGRVADQAGFPASTRDLETTVTVLGPASIDGTHALDYLLRLEATEQARIFMAADGDLTVHSRYRTSSVAAEFTDDGTGDSPYRDVKIVQPAALVYGKVTVTADGQAPVVLTDPEATSDNDITIDAPLLATTHQQRSLGEHVLATYRRPQTRVEGLSIPLHRDFDTLAPVVLGLELGDRVQFTRTIRDEQGQPVGDPIVVEQIVEGISHRFNTREWTTDLNLSPADPVTYAQWGVGQWDVDRWGY